MPRLRSDVPPPPSNAAYAAAMLRDLLVRGEVEPGSRIKEADIADQLGLSRGPVREAFRMLQEDGLLELLPNRGAVVRTYTALDVLELYALRSRLGSLAIRRVTHELAPDLEARLRPHLDELQAAVAAGDEPRVLDADLEFQDELVAASALPYTTQIFHRSTMRLRMFVAVLDTRYDDHFAAILHEDQELYDAVLGGDPALADGVWRTRLRGWVQDFIDKLPDEDFDADLWVALASDQLAAADPS